MKLSVLSFQHFTRGVTSCCLNAPVSTAVLNTLQLLLEKPNIFWLC